MFMSVTLLKKIGAADLLGKVVLIVREQMGVGDVKDAFGVAGVCNAIEEGTSTYGDWVRFIGDFTAVNYFTGEQFRSEKTHVPGVLEAVLLRGLEPLKDTVKELQHTTVTTLTSEIEFAFTVALKRLPDDEKGGVSYEYITTPKTEIKANDRISHLSAMLSLEAPKTVKVEAAANDGDVKPKAGKAK